MELTKTQAIAEGYLYWGKKDAEFQHLQDIKDLSEDDFQHGIPVLVAKDPYYVPSIEAEQIKELIADQIQCEIDDNTADDTDSVRDVIDEIDFSEIAGRINNALSGNKYYQITDISVILDRPFPGLDSDK